MADKKVGGLSLSIGLTLSQLQSDFLAAEQTVKQGIAALNRQQNIIKLRMEADTAGLDAVADKTKIIAVQERSLTQLLEMQRDKLTLATKAYHDVAQSKGANSTAAKQLEASMERERLAVARLEAQLKNLSAQKISVDTSHLQDNISADVQRQFSNRVDFTRRYQRRQATTFRQRSRAVSITNYSMHVAFAARFVYH